MTIGHGQDGQVSQVGQVGQVGHGHAQAGQVGLRSGLIWYLVREGPCRAGGQTGTVMEDKRGWASRARGGRRWGQRRSWDGWTGGQGVDI